MRLIDADALKEKINAFYDSLFVGCVSSDLIAYASGVDSIIDNAPTVEPTFGLFKEMLCAECEKRPQGEWVKIFENPFTNGYICSFCGHKIQVTEQFLSKVNKCESCGAEMRGEDNGKEETT